MKRIALSIFAAALMTVAARAQSGPYPVRSLDYDLWCTEQEHLPYERCEKRLPEDVKKFDAYRAIIEKYEIPYLKEKDQRLRFDEDILHNDPVDHSNDTQTNVTPPNG